MKRISGEDASTVSPTLGFNIKTLEFGGCVRRRAGSRVDRPAAAAGTTPPLASASLVPCPWSCRRRSYQLNVWDVGGQKTLRPYWRNYFEQTDGLVWVVDSTDRRRLADCAEVRLAIRGGGSRVELMLAAVRRSQGWLG